MERRKTALLLAGPSGGGKTTVMTELLKSDFGFELVRSATTRELRGDGNDGEYIYLSKSDFLELEKSGEMLEFTEYGGNLYGTPNSEIKRINELGKTPILILDLNGAATLRAKKLGFDIYAVYVYAEPRVLSERLAKRYADVGGEKSERYITRMENNRRDYARAREWCHLFDKAVLSDSVSKTAKNVFEAFLSGKKEISPEPFLKMAEEFK